MIVIIPCPHCQTKLNLPENVAGKLVRCPSCKEVFRATKEVLEESVQAGLPQAAAPTPVNRQPPADDEEERRPGRKPPLRDKYRDDDDDGDDIDNGRARDRDRDDFDRRDTGADIDEIVAHAKAQTRPAGYVMLGAFLFTSINIIGNAILTMLTQLEMGMDNAPQGQMGILIAGMVCGIFIFAPILVFVMLGGWSLLRLGSRGLIITAVVMNGLLLLVLGAGLLFNVIILASGQAPIPIYLILPTVVMNSISCIANLAAGVMAIRVLILADVNLAYEMQREAPWRRRRRY